MTTEKKAKLRVVVNTKLLTAEVKAGIAQIEQVSDEQRIDKFVEVFAKVLSDCITFEVTT